MHVGHIILVEAESAEEARDNVYTRLNGEVPEPQWSDWHNATAGSESFAGRWKGHYFGEENELDVLCYADNATLAEEVIVGQIEQRKKELADYRAKVLAEGYDVMTTEYDPYASSYDMKPWYVKRIAQILNDDWSSESYVFDLETFSASLVDFAKRVIDNPEKQFLVVVDFHF